MRISRRRYRASAEAWASIFNGTEPSRELALSAVIELVGCSAIRAAADDLHNTPAICRRSYVHDTVIAAFEDGVLERFSEALAGNRSPTRRTEMLARIVAPAAAA